MCMGAMNKKIQEMQNRRAEYHEKKKHETMNRIAQFLSAEEKNIFFSGDGFIELPETERQRLRIESYTYMR